jgi:heme exporter protein C
MAIDDREKKARLSSVLGVLGFISVPLSYVSVQLMTLHPGGGVPLSKLNLTSPMMMTLMVALLGVTLIYLSLLKRTYDLMKMEDGLSEMRYQGGDFR